MENVIILVAGMPGAGKSTIAEFIAGKLKLPLISYDKIKSKAWDIAQSINKREELHDVLGDLAYKYFWFFMEELVNSQSSFVSDFMFHPSNEETINKMTGDLGYRIITVMLDCDVKVAYNRFIERNNKDRHPGIAVKEMPFSAFKKGTMPNREFACGTKIVFNTNDVNVLEKNAIIEDILDIL